MKTSAKKKRYIYTSSILLIYVIIVLLSKIIRHTILKATLVDMSIGNGMISIINNGITHFSIGFNELNATNNSIFVFKIFKILGLSTTIDYEILITIIWNIIFIILLSKIKNKLTIFEFIFICMTIAVLNIWDFCLAKEPMQMLYFVIIFFILLSNKIKHRFLFSLIIIFIACITYRNYYILVLLFSLFSSFIINKFIVKKNKVSYTDIIKIVVLFGLVYMSIVFLSKRFSLDYYNQLIYFSSSVSKAKTDIYGLFKSTNIIIMTIDYLLLILRMLFPIELIKFGISYFIYAAYQIMLSSFIIKSFINIKKNSNYQNIALFIFIGFLFASGIFEPDFGSWIRHEAVTIPIIMIAIGLTNKNENINKC